MGWRMRTKILFLAAFGPLAGLAACREEPSVAEQFNSLAAEVENKGREYEAEAENLVAAEERARMLEAEALIRQTQNAIGNAAVDVDINSN
jgi:hypothetical protein